MIGCLIDNGGLFLKEEKRSWGLFTNMQSLVVNFLKIQKERNKKSMEQCSSQQKHSIKEFQKLEWRFCGELKKLMNQIERRDHRRIGVLPSFEIHGQFVAMKMKEEIGEKLHMAFNDLCPHPAAQAAHHSIHHSSIWSTCFTFTALATEKICTIS